MADNDSQLEDLKNRLNTLQAFVIAVLVLVCLGLVLQAALAIYHRFFKKQKKQEAPTNVVVKSAKRSDSSKKKKSENKSTRSKKNASTSTKSQKSSKKSQGSTRSSKKITYSKKKSSKRGSSSKKSKSESESNLSKKEAINVSIEKDDKKTQEKKTSAPSSLELNIADPPPYSSDKKRQESNERDSGSTENVPRVEKVDNQKIPEVPLVVTPMATAISPAPPVAPVPVQVAPQPTLVLQQQIMKVPEPVEVPVVADAHEKLIPPVPQVSLVPSVAAPFAPVPFSAAPSIGRAVPSLSLASSKAPARNTWL